MDDKHIKKKKCSKLLVICKLQIESWWDTNTYLLEWLILRLIIPTVGEYIKQWNSHMAGGKVKW